MLFLVATIPDSGFVEARVIRTFIDVEMGEYILPWRWMILVAEHSVVISSMLYLVLSLYPMRVLWNSKWKNGKDVRVRVLFVLIIV